MIAACEVLLPSTTLSHMLRDNRVHQISGYIQQHEMEGSMMQHLDTVLARYVVQGLVDVEEAVGVARTPDVVRRAAMQVAEL